MNTAKKTIFSYFSLLGIPLGRKIEMDEIKGIKIERAKSSRRVNSRVNSTTLSETEFRAYIYFDEKKVMLSHNTDKEALKQSMRGIADDLTLKLIS